MAHRVVCISRMMAADGEAIGRLVAERLGFRYVDDEVIALAAESAGLAPTVLETAEHYQTFFGRMMDALFSGAGETEGYFKQRDRGADARASQASTAPPPEELRRLIQQAIVAIAHRGQAVIVAHAASMALTGHADVLRVHVVASTKNRLRRLWLANMLISEDEHAKAIAESDLQRAKYLARFYDVHEESPTHYDLVLNTDVLQAEQAAAAVVAAAS